MEPIACRVCADPEKAHAAHQKLIHFANDSPWSDRDVRREAAQYGIDALTAVEAIKPGSSTTPDSSSKELTRSVCSGSTPDRPARSRTARSASASA